MFMYPITIHHLYISPGHNYFGHPPEAPGMHSTLDVDCVQVEAGQGIVGDRFYGHGPGFDGHVTFFAWEVFQLLRAQLALTQITAAPLRRNVIVAGVPLNQLIGQEFWIGDLHLRGAKHCAPCRWMDISISKGALPFLKGRGGLRAQALSSGTLCTGALQLMTAIPLKLDRVTEPLARPNLP